MRRHVVILGAGASIRSGFPSAHQLRLLMTSPLFTKEWLESFRPELDFDFLESLPKTIDQVQSSISGTGVRLFRDGAFATVDEFSKLATKGEYAKYVPELKRVMAFVLALRNPEHVFHNSDYVPFVQRLFQTDEARLREDVTILSFNYDCYFEFVLARAYQVRRHIDAKRLEEHTNVLNGIYGGFFNVQDRAWTAGKFKVLKLHGSIAFANKSENKELNHDLLFGRPEKSRILQLLLMAAKAPTPPVVFPWELFQQNEQTYTPLNEFCSSHPKEWPREDLHALLTDTWKQAREAVLEAEKISFVGISAHHYLTPGFAFLFADKRNEFEAVVANVQNKNKELLYESEMKLNSLSICGKINALLKELKCSPRQYPGERYVRPRNSFEEFINTEM